MTTVNDCMSAVSDRFGVSLLDLRSDRRHAPLARARQAVYWLARHTTEHSLPKIARCVGRRDHTTIMHGITQTEKRRAADPEFKHQTDILLEKLQPETTQRVGR